MEALRTMGTRSAPDRLAWPNELGCFSTIDVAVKGEKAKSLTLQESLVKQVAGSTIVMSMTLLQTLFLYLRRIVAVEHLLDSV
jgi:hypothetical protein